MADLPQETVEIFTDGACSGNPGPGGWGVVLRSEKGQEREISGGELETTNNRMELTAAIEGLDALKRPCVVHLYTDSTYLRDGMSHWLSSWKKNNWRTTSNQLVKNLDLWHRLDELAQKHQVKWHWVKSHAGHPENERADLLARNAIVQLMMKAEIASS